jgi:hypothetical protein
VIAACHVILAVPAVLVCHFVLARTKEMNDVKRQSVRKHAFNRGGDITDARYSILVLKQKTFFAASKILRILETGYAELQQNGRRTNAVWGRDTNTCPK